MIEGLRDELYLRMAIEEAKKSTSIDGYHVGAIIVKDRDILPRAYSGENSDYNHAEEWAIARYNGKLQGAIIYITMEPCNIRRSKRKACCDWIIKSGINRVVFGVYDPDTYVKCNGADRLQKAGVEVCHLRKLEMICKELTPTLLFGV